MGDATAKRMDRDTWSCRLLTAIKAKLEIPGSSRGPLGTAAVDAEISELIPIHCREAVLEALAHPPYVCACGVLSDLPQCLKCWDEARHQAIAAKMLAEMTPAQLEELKKQAR